MTMRNKKRDDHQEEIDPSWYVKYEPRSTNATAIHTRKLNDVRESLISMLNGSSKHKILLLTGPSGSSKSTVVKLLASELVPAYRSRTYSLLQRKNAKSGLLVDAQESTVVEFSNEDSTDKPMYAFENFLESASYLVGPNLKVILVEDLPNVFYDKTKQRFQLALQKWLSDDSKVLPPLVISITECEIPALWEDDSQFATPFSIDHKYIAETVLGNEVLRNPKVRRIKFNPINKTLMTKTLKAISQFEKRTLMENNKWGEPCARSIAQIVNDCSDVRSAIATFQFWSQSRRNNRDSGIEIKDEGLSFFHAVGKIVYGSKQTAINEEVVQALLDNYISIYDPVLKSGVFENYHINSDMSLTTASAVTEILSSGDEMARLKEQTEYYLRAVRHELSLEQKSNTINERVMKFPREFKLRRRQREYTYERDDFKELSFDKYQQSYSNKNIDLYYGFYSPCIRKKLAFKKRSLQAYQQMSQIKGFLMPSQYQLVDEKTDYLSRLGGEITGIEADSDMLVENASFATSESKSRNFASPQYTLEQENQDDEEDFLIEDASDLENDVTENYEEDESLIKILSQYPSQKSTTYTIQVNDGDDGGSGLDDSDLELLINK